MNITDKMIALGGIACLTGLQIFAWQTGHDGQVFALCSAGIGALIGYITGIKISMKK